MPTPFDIGLDQYRDSYEYRKFMKELGPPPIQYVSIINRVWYHGTTKNNLWRIKQDEFFHEGTWFARHMEYARKMGGNIVIQVNVFFDVYESEWQVCAKNKIPVSAITDIFTIYKKKVR